MISRKIHDLRHFTLILSIGAILNNILRYIFRILALFLLLASDYKYFTIIIWTHGIMLPFSSFLLHIPLTRKIREAKNEVMLHKTFKNFAFNYSITSIFSFMVFIFLSFYFFNALEPILIFFLASSLVFYSFSEFFIGLSNGFLMPIKSVVIPFVGNLIMGLLAIISLFVISLQNINSFIFFFGLSYLGSFLMGLYLYKTEIKNYLISGRKIIEKKEIKENIKNSLFLVSTNFVKNFSLLMSIITAASILSDISFKVFDLSLMIISLIAILGNSLTSALNSKKNLEKQPNLKFLKKNIIPIIIINFLILVFLLVTNLDRLVLLNFLGENSENSYYFIRISLFIPIPIIISAYFGGRILNFGEYSKYLISSIFGLMGSIIILFLAFSLNISYLLIIALIFEQIISLLFLIIYDYLQKRV